MLGSWKPRWQWQRAILPEKKKRFVARTEIEMKGGTCAAVLRGPRPSVSWQLAPVAALLQLPQLPKRLSSLDLGQSEKHPNMQPNWAMCNLISCMRDLRTSAPMNLHLLFRIVPF